LYLANFFIRLRDYTSGGLVFGYRRLLIPMS
jgi:hypothetical protein